MGHGDNRGAHRRSSAPRVKKSTHRVLFLQDGTMGQGDIHFYITRYIKDKKIRRYINFK